jgi:hypothetical protein
MSNEVLECWFDQANRPYWFDPSPDFDEMVRRQLAHLHADAVERRRSRLQEWDAISFWASRIEAVTSTALEVRSALRRCALSFEKTFWAVQQEEPGARRRGSLGWAGHPDPAEGFSGFARRKPLDFRRKARIAMCVGGLACPLADAA